jgi:mannose-6-phosphate isomerase
MVNGSAAREFSVTPHHRRVEKPWGWEILWAETPFYCGKLLHIIAGKRLSLQYHDEKIESQFLVSGRALLIIDGPDGELHQIEMEAGVGYTIRPYQRHRLIGITDTEIMEVSTPETGTTYRLEDDFARPHETEAVRRQDRA